MDGWSLQIVLQEIFASYYGARLPTPVSYRKFATWLAERDRGAAEDVWRKELAGFDTPTLVAPSTNLYGPVRRDTRSIQVSEEMTQALRELARTQHTTVNTVLQAAFAQLLGSLTGQRDVVFGTVVSGRPAEVVGAESMVGLLINTIPVRAKITPDTTVAALLTQLQGAHNRTLEHQHLGLADIHRLTGLKSLFDTVFVYENYPTETDASGSVGELVISEPANRDFYHYPLTIQAAPGRELYVRMQFRTDVFDDAGIDALIERFEQVLAAMTADPAQRLPAGEPLEWGQRAAHNGAASADLERGRHVYLAPDTENEQLVADIWAEVLGVDRVGVDQSFFELGGDSLTAMRATEAINRAFDIDMAVTALIDAPSVRSLSEQVSGSTSARLTTPAQSASSHDAGTG
jgi:non-ribosomal peptide synthetase component F